MAYSRAHFVALGLVVITTSLILSRIWHVPYIFTLIAFAAWAFFGHLVTADDDLRGGWSNPDGTQPFPWRELVVKGAILAILCAVVVLFPVVRDLGTSH